MKILVAVDPSQYSREAIRFVKSVEWPEKSEIYLIHIIEMKDAPPLVPSGGPSSWDRVIAQARGKMVTEARLILEQTKKDIHKQNPSNIKSLVLEGTPGAEILHIGRVQPHRTKKAFPTLSLFILKMRHHIPMPKETKFDQIFMNDNTQWNQFRTGIVRCSLYKTLASILLDV